MNARKHTIDRDDLMNKLNNMAKSAWSTSEAAATLQKVNGIVMSMESNDESASIKRIEFATWDFAGWSDNGLENIYKCSKCGYETNTADLIWCPVCGRLAGTVEKNRITALQANEAKARKEKRYVERPMTIDEVARSIGRPVWCEEYRWSNDRDHKYTDGWALVHEIKVETGEDGKPHVKDWQITDATYGDWEFYCYGWQNDRGWRAWRTKPTEAERKAAEWNG